MCLAVPGKLLSVEGDDPLLRTGKVDFGGVVKAVSLAYVPEAEVGDYVVVHVGFAISRLDEAEAQEVFEYLREIAALDEEGREAFAAEGGVGSEPGQGRGPPAGQSPPPGQDPQPAQNPPAGESAP